VRCIYVRGGSCDTGGLPQARSSQQHLVPHWQLHRPKELPVGFCKRLLHRAHPCGILRQGVFRSDVPCLRELPLCCVALLDSQDGGCVLRSKAVVPERPKRPPPGVPPPPPTPAVPPAQRCRVGGQQLCRFDTLDTTQSKNGSCVPIACSEILDRATCRYAHCLSPPCELPRMTGNLSVNLVEIAVWVLLQGAESIANGR
jgi:hypothetical protein